MKDSIVSFKGKKDQIVIILDKNEDFGVLKQELANKIEASRKFFGYAKTYISFEGRLISADEEKQLINVINNNSDLEVSFIKDKSNDKLIENSCFNISSESYCKENITLYHMGIIRSGQSLIYDGSIVIHGDLNPGGIVKATGNVVIFGNALGHIHAGKSGNTNCIISAVGFLPLQISIGSVATYLPKKFSKSKTRDAKPSYAFVKESQIYIQPLV